MCDTIKYVLSNDFSNSRLYLLSWDANSTVDNFMGLAWSSYSDFLKVQKMLSVNPSLGTSTCFTSKEEAEQFAKEYNIKRYVIRKVLYSEDNNSDIEILARNYKKEYVMPGISENAISFLQGL